MKTPYKGRRLPKKIAGALLMFTMMSKNLTKRQKQTIFLMLSMPETSGAVKRLKCEYDKPGNITQLAAYYMNFLEGMQQDALFAPIAAKLTAAQNQVGVLAKAEIAVLSKFPGKKQARDTEYLNTEIVMDDILNEVQKAGDADIPNSEKIFKTHQLKIREYSRSEKGELEVKADKGTFIVRCRKAGSNNSGAAYLWMISVDKSTWYVGDFRKKSTGLITKCGDNQLKVGTLYYIKAMTDSNEGQSGWTQIVERYCI